jgi:hypothetical protein
MTIVTITFSKSFGHTSYPSQTVPSTNKGINSLPEAMTELVKFGEPKLARS